ncbi:hypothetical protein [Variovorax paradoxus]|uniref:Tsi6 domain-containing protein n=1 Tax=Variovorax paradoxus TaxID=34073 RepID=A0A6I6HN09_VARPD|nr:hypothetical protein [Variovorax paradoxus]QGW84386.1 hypothetical protein GOQ09_23685 [Variovorax paradoxus]
MTQAIDSIKLKAAAEHLEWACQQYPNVQDVQALYRGLLPLIEDAKASRVLMPVDRQEAPGWYLMAEGIYRPYENPDIEGAYYKFRTEMGGGLTDQDKKFLAKFSVKEGVNKKKDPS